MFLFLVVVGLIIFGILCFVLLDLYEKLFVYLWREYWKMYKVYLFEMMVKACYRFFEFVV